MIVGLLTIDLAIFEAQSLKDKRRVIRGLKERIRGRFNVSVAEIGHANAAKRCTLGVAMVAESARPMHGQFDLIVELVRTVGGLTLVDYQREFF